MPCLDFSAPLCISRRFFLSLVHAVAALTLACGTCAHAANAPGLQLSADATSVPAGTVLHLTASGIAPAASISFFDGSHLIASVPADERGIAALGVASLASGQHTLTAATGTLSSNALAVTITPLPAPFSLTSNVTSLLGGASAYLSTLGLPADATGTITFRDGNTPLTTLTRAADTPAYETYGDSITAGIGVTRYADAYVSLLASELGFQLTNHAESGFAGCDVMTREALANGTGPSQTDAPLYTLMIGSNDAWNAQGLEPFRLCHQAAITWLATPLEYKVLAGGAGVAAITGPWTYAPNSPAGAPFATLYNNSGSGSARVTITSSGAPIYLWYLLENATPGQFTVALDGVPTGVTYGVQPPQFLTSPLGTNATGIALLRLPAAAGTHVLEVNLLGGSLGIVGAGTPPSPGSASVHPTVVVSDVPSQNATCPRDTAASLDTYTVAALADAALLQADGLDIRTVTTRDLLLGTPAEMADCVHPNTLGMRHLADAFERVLAGLPTAPYRVVAGAAPAANVQLATIGKRTLIASYSGDSRYAPADSAPIDIQVDDPATQVLLSTPSQIVPYNHPVTVTATVVPGGGGTLHFFDQTNTDAANTIVDHNTGSVTFTPLPGTHLYYAVYQANDGHYDSRSDTLSVTVQGNPSTLSLTASTQHIAYGQPVHLNAQLSVPTCNGKLTFSDAVTGSLGGDYASHGFYEMDVPVLPGGSRSITVSYSGDPICAPQVSAPTIIQVDPLSPSIVVTPPTGNTFGSPIPLHFDVLGYNLPAQPMLAGTIDPALNNSAVFLGDSITAWWTAPIHNAGIAGQTTADMILRFNTDVLGHGYERMFLLAGANDILHTDASTDTILGNINYMAVTAAAAGIRPILCTILPIRFADGTSGASRVDPLNAAIVALAAKNNYLVVDYHAALADHTDLIYDGVHPGEIGHDLMQTAVARTILLTSGTVTLPNGTSAVLSTSGTATLTDTEPSAGTKTFNAVYNGDTSFIAKASQVSFRIAPAPTRVRLRATPLAGYSGTSSLLIATTSNASPLPTTGVVRFFDGTTLTGVANLQADGTASLTSGFLPAGNHTFTAEYPATDNFNGSTSAAVSLAVGLTSTTLSLSTAAPSYGFGSSISITANLLPAPATGTITLLDGGAVLGQATLINGVADFTFPAGKLGTHTLTAQYAGDTFNAAAQSPAVTINVTPVATTLTLAPLPAEVAYGTAFALQASLTPAGINGSIVFTDTVNGITTTLGQATLSSGAASLPLGTLAVGTHSFSASFAGDASTQAATSMPVTTTVAPLTTTLTLSASAATAPYGSALTVIAAISPATAGGIVTLTESASQTSRQATLTGGTVTFALGTLATGTHTFLATYAGDPDDASTSSQPVAIAITPVVSTLTLTVPASQVTGTPVTLQATLSPGNASGTVLFRDAAAGTLGQATIAQGMASLTLATLPAASYSITATYSGDTNDAPSTSSARALQITLIPTALTLSAPATSPYTADVTLTASITPAAASGLLTFTDNGTSVGSAAIVNGSASMHIATLAPGLHTLRAAYAGDATDAPATAAPATLNITQDSTVTTLTLAQTTLPAGAPVTVNLAITSSSNAAPTGLVTVHAGTTVVATAMLAHASANAAYATLTLDSLSFGLGTFPLTATYAGDTANAGSDSSAAPVSFTVVPSPTTAILTLGRAAIPVQSSVTLTAVLTAAAGTVPSGSINFMNGTQTIATVPLTVAGTASATLTAPSLGAWPITAVYNPTALFAVSTSAVQTLTVTPPLTFAVASASVTLMPGGTTADTLTLTPLAGYAGAVTLGCTSPVAYVTCTATGPATLAGTTDVPLLITVSSTLHSSSSSAPLAAGLILLLLPLATRRRFRHLTRAALVLAGIAMTGALSGCGTTNPTAFNTVPSGVQTITVNASAAGLNFTSDIAVNVTH